MKYLDEVNADIVELQEINTPSSLEAAMTIRQGQMNVINEIVPAYAKLKGISLEAARDIIENYREYSLFKKRSEILLKKIFEN
jgi:CRISPR/Cas system Type II protein with McrA/HNH and RuvC-like nuclease domain